MQLAAAVDLAIPSALVMNVVFSTALLAAACLCAVAQGKYVAQEDCLHAESCEYSYSAEAITSMGDSDSKLYVSSTVEVFCDTVGKYKAKEAKQYCINVKQTSFSAGDERNRLSEASSNAEKLFNGPFCFVQTDDGKVVSVRHGTNEKAQIVNFKKGIAAAFQANFKNTQVELEQDTLSKHYSRYSYERIASDHVIMHRVVDSDGVVQYAESSGKGSPLKMEKLEDIEYKAGKLLRSDGRTVLNMNGPVDPVDYSRFESVDETMLESRAVTFDSTLGQGGLRGAGKYSMRLKKCSKKPRSLLKRSAEDESLLTTSNLHAIVERDIETDFAGEMNKLRNSIPSVRKALDALKQNINDTATISGLKRLLILEANHGPLSGYKPVLSDVVEYLNSEKDFEMRALLFSLLAAEGSLKSQEIILNAIKTTTDRKERNTLCVQLAFVRNVHPSIVDQIEALIASSNDTTDPLVLAYGALAASSPQLQSRIVQFLQDRVDKARDNVSALIHLVHSLGNTESSSVENILLQLIAHEHSGVRLASVYALRYSIESEGVQDALLNGLRNQDDADFAVMVARALIAGAESKQGSGASPIGSAPFQAVLQHANNNTDLHAMIHYYLVLLGPKAPKEYLDILRTAVQKRAAWNDNSDPMYDLVQDSATRSSDITNYPTNKAFLFAKSLGTSSIKVDVAFGAFVGYGGSANPNYYKLYAKGLARGYAFGKTATAFDALLTSENKPGGSSIYNRLYINIVGKVLVDFTKEIPTCKSWSYPLYKSPDYQLLSSTNSVYVYIASMSYTVNLNANLAVSASLTACINKCVSLKAALIPQVVVTVSGSASGTLAETVKGSITASGSVQYQLQPQITANYQLLKGPFELCLSLAHSWPVCNVNTDVSYQLRSITMCKGVLGLKYPCGFSWGDSKKWEAASKTWELAKSDPSVIWSSCDPSKTVCPVVS